MYLWTDFETTGLKKNASILECALILTDDKYETQIEKHWIVYTPEAVWEAGALEMHAKTGLAVLVSSKQESIPYTVFHREFSDFITHDVLSSLPHNKKIQLAGASVHQDHIWLSEKFPNLSQFFSHRVFDSSTLRSFAKELLGNEVVKSWDEENNSKNNRTRHRALDDIRCSLDFTRWIKATLQIK